MSFFDSIGDFFSLLLNFIELAFNGIISFIETVMMSFTILPIFAGFLPPIIYSSALIFVSLSAIRLVFGK